jgi:nitroreductase
MPEQISADIFRAIEARHCKRAFLPTPVPRELLGKILGLAANAPSSKNTQPWQVTVLSGARRDELSRRICGKFDSREVDEPEYVYSVEPTPAEYRARARACGFALYELKEIDAGDRDARRAHERENYVFFGAPIEMIFHLPRGAMYGNFLDMGMFLQNVMLGLVGAGLGSCPQASLTDYSRTIRECIGLPDDRIIVCGLAVGYVDDAATVNTFVPARLSTDEYVTWLTDDGG